MAATGSRSLASLAKMILSRSQHTDRPVVILSSSCALDEYREACTLSNIQILAASFLYYMNGIDIDIMKGNKKYLLHIRRVYVKHLSPASDDGPPLNKK